MDLTRIEPSEQTDALDGNPSVSYTIATLRERPDLESQMTDIEDACWPRFMLENPATQPYWCSLIEYYANFQFMLVDGNDTVLATGNSIPVKWNGSTEDLPAGWDAALQRGLYDYEHQHTLRHCQLLRLPLRRSFNVEDLAGRCYEPCACLLRCMALRR